MSAPILEIYGRDDCRFCAAAVAFAQKHKITYAYYDLARELARSDLDNRTRGSEPVKTVPQIFLGPHRIGGYDDLRRSFPVIQQIIGG